jgi:hypothetical protein
MGLERGLRRGVGGVRAEEEVLKVTPDHVLYDVMIL